MKKILYIVNVDWFFISHRLPIALKAMEEGYEVHLACTVTSKAAELEATGIKVHSLNLVRGRTRLPAELKLLWQIFSVIKRVHPDVLHTVTIKPVLFGNIVARLFNIPVRVSSISGLGHLFIAKKFKTRLFKIFIAFLYRIALKKAAAVIFHNKSDYKILADMKAVDSTNSIFTAGSGVDLNYYQPTAEPEDFPVVMLIARLLVDKGVNEFVHAATALKQQRPEIRMVLVGDLDPSNPQSITKPQLDKWVSQKNIEYWGFSSDVRREISQANIIVLPSYREGLPKSLIEAAACGRAVITTDTAGCRDAVLANQSGLLIPSKTYIPLIEAILKLIDDKELRYRFANRSRELAQQKFDIEDVIDVHMKIYSQRK